MMRFLVLCLVLRAAIAKEFEVGSGNGEIDDEDLVPDIGPPVLRTDADTVGANKSTGGGDGAQNEFITIVIVVAVSVVALSIAAIVAVVLVRRRMHNRQQGIYSVPAEQGQKGAV
ncbi:uncharacterized protein si:dkey-262k9.2 [Hypomesus transpacificus]|uniref:uncharacterized protein si:dkey-262k9.2 n=1 Tax=Hypomesus transpacificus TaxID=137520 RepID=UPI001F07163A|nr:uncharacterized protein si:dkey-262k9.2 [Hypomesus transpacificus]